MKLFSIIQADKTGSTMIRSVVNTRDTVRYIRSDIAIDRNVIGSNEMSLIRTLRGDIILDAVCPDSINAANSVTVRLFVICIQSDGNVKNVSHTFVGKISKDEKEVKGKRAYARLKIGARYHSRAAAEDVWSILLFVQKLLAIGLLVSLFIVGLFLFINDLDRANYFATSTYVLIVAFLSLIIARKLIRREDIGDSLRPIKPLL